MTTMRQEGKYQGMVRASFFPNTTTRMRADHQVVLEETFSIFKVPGFRMLSE